MKLFLINHSKRSFSTQPTSRTSSLRDIIMNYVPVTSQAQRLKLLLEYSIGALRDPTRADFVSAVGDLSSHQILKDIRRKMLMSSEGRLILEEKPRVSESTWNKEKLLSLPQNTFGYQYALWMSKFKFTSEERPVTKYVPDLELAYILQRYRETHDVLHTLLQYDITVAEELAVKWFEMIQLGLPSTALSAFVGPLNLILNRDLQQIDQLVNVYLPHILQQAQTSQFYMNIYFEKHFDHDIVREI